MWLLGGSPVTGHSRWKAENEVMLISLRCDGCLQNASCQKGPMQFIGAVVNAKRTGFAPDARDDSVIGYAQGSDHLHASICNPVDRFRYEYFCHCGFIFYRDTLIH